LAAAVAAAVAFAAYLAPATAQQARAGKLQIVRGGTVESFTPKPQGSLPAVVRGEFAREREAPALPRARWVMSSGSRGVWFYNSDAESLINCWRRSSGYVGQYEVVCVQRELSLPY
jgi:hypothetical protein